MLLPCPAGDSTGKRVHKPFSLDTHSVIFCTKEAWKVVRNAFDTPARRPSITDRNHVTPSYPFHARMWTMSARPQAPANHKSRRSSPDSDAAVFFRRSHATQMGVSPLAGSQEFKVGGAL